MKELKEKVLYEECGVTEALLRLAIPTVIGQIILVIYNMTDTFFVGLTGNDAMLTAVTVCMPAFMFLSAISNLFGIGGASVISRALGAGNHERVRNTSAFAFWGCFAITFLYAASAFLGRHMFIDLLGGTNIMVHDHAVSYMVCTVAAGGLMTSAGALLSHLLRAEGRSFLAGFGVTLGGILNIILDPLFMFYILPPGREALGAAIATALGNTLSLVYFILVLVVIRKQTNISLRIRKGMLQEKIPADVLSAGLPACVMTLFENVSYAFLDKLMSLQGLAMQTGIGVAKKINMLAHSIVRGIAQGALPLIGYNYASGNYRRMRDSVRTAQILAIGTALVCMAVNLALADEMTGLFIHHEAQSFQYGTKFLRILCIGGPPSASAYLFISFFQATGEGKRSLLLALLRKGLIDIPLMFLLGAVIPVYGIVIATPAADAICCITAALMYLRYIRKMA